MASSIALRSATTLVAASMESSASFSAFSTCGASLTIHGGAMFGRMPLTARRARPEMAPTSDFFSDARASLPPGNSRQGDSVHTDATAGDAQLHAGSVMRGQYITNA